MSGGGDALFATVINRLTREETEAPITSANLSLDVRTFTSAFDFEIEFQRGHAPKLNSHDFVEFWVRVQGRKHQVGVVYAEDFVKSTTPNSYRFQANGRDFLAQLMSFPFKERQITQGTSWRSFLERSMQETYLKDYCAFRGRKLELVDKGIYPGPLFIQDVATSPRASVIAEYAETGLNLVYQDRLGRMVVYGRDFRESNRTGFTLSDDGDPNVIDFIERQNFSKVFSSCSVFWAGMENLGDVSIKAAKGASRLVLNTDPRAAGLNQLNQKTYSSQDIIQTLGASGANSRMDAIAKSTVRKSNQNLSLPVLTVASAVYTGPAGQVLPYEQGQVWRLKSSSYGIDRDYILAAIAYQQAVSEFKVQLGFVEPDTLI